MPESAQLASARAHLARAEAGYRSKDGLAHLREGLALLEEITVDGAPKDRAVATNLLVRYAGGICEAIRRAVDADRAPTEPELEHWFQVLLAFDAAELALPDFVRPLKVDVVRRLIDHYYEGHSDEAKRKALAQLAGITDDV
jgi:hypothetical protein